MVTIEFRNSEVILIQRALKIYAKFYQGLRAKETDPIHRVDLLGFENAADRLSTRLRAELLKVRAK